MDLEAGRVVPHVARRSARHDQVGDRHVRIEPREHAEAHREAVDKAYAAKYTHPRIGQVMRGFRTRRRRETTMELMPRSVSRSRPEK